MHRLDGGLERGESDARSLSADGFPIYTPPDLDRARWIPVRDIKYVVFGSVEDPDLEADPGEKREARKASRALPRGGGKSPASGAICIGSHLPLSACPTWN